MYTEEQYILEIGQALADDHAAVMVGAGFSKNAEKISTAGREFLNWNQLSDLFYEKLYGDSEYPGKNYCSSLRLAEEVEIMVGRPGLEKILKQAVPDEDFVPSRLYKKLMELPWCDVFTTNYDTLLERTADQITNRRYNVVVCQEDLVNSSNAPRIVKLHGSFPSHRPFIITEEDYRTYPVKFAPMVNTVQQSLLENVFCMIGFSCEDPNFIRWIGWIHDHLSKSSSQKIYMIAVTHVAEAQKRLYFEKNIIVVDLQELWPSKSIVERLDAFFARLRACVDKKTTKLSWFNWGKECKDSTFESNIEQMHRLCLSYPGWIFLPWDLKSKTSYMIDHFDPLGKIDKLSYPAQVDYMYEYVKFLDIAGRPILSQTAECFWSLLEAGQQEQEVTKEIRVKTQTIYLHLLRTYRELGNWEQVEACKKSIHEEQLNYEDRQFLCAEECRLHLFRFEAKDLEERLEKWNISEGDVYWPIIKAYLYSAIGENEKAIDLLMKDLITVRKQLMKDGQNVYLASIEESCVSLVNFIHQADTMKYGNSANLEKCIHQANAVSWWDENSKYDWHLKAEQHITPPQTIKYQYNLSKTYSMHFGRDNADIYTSMEYWRFFEQTGHTFRIGNVTCAGGFEGSIKRLYRYYPYWCLVQMLISQETKYIDYLFGRADLALLTQQQADEDAHDYLHLFESVIEQLKGDDLWVPKSVYEQAAKVLPEILFRFTYKCSVGVLDELLDLLLKLCLSNRQTELPGIGSLLKGVVHAYTPEQQWERIHKLLRFPVASDQFSKYHDPLNDISVPTKKHKMEPDLYYNILPQLKQQLESENEFIRSGAKNRFITLWQLIELDENDKQYLIQQLEKENDLRSVYILYRLKENDPVCLKAMIENTCELMKQDSSQAHFSDRCGGEYAELLWAVDDIDFTSLNTIEWMNTLETLIQAMVHWKHSAFGAEERLRQCCIFALRLLISMWEKEHYQMSEPEEQAYQKLKQVVKEAYGSAVALEIAASELHAQNDCDSKKLEHDLWMCNAESIHLANKLLNRISHSKKMPDENSVMLRFIKKSCEIFSIRLLHADFETELALMRFLLKAAKMNLLTSENIDFINLKLNQLLEETVITKEDDEKTAIHKTLSREAACALALEFYQKNACADVVLKWKDVSENVDEFLEIRQIATYFS